ncbi:MAG: hypothetical protein M3R07_03865 [Gemmatimonadota bacterium]|nr:hypothetical protein [Gemmatimonadota bacterium]
MTSPASLAGDRAAAPASVDRNQWIFPIGLGILAALYLLQTLTPLRLDTDSLNYLIMATAMADGQPVPAIGLPTGYSVIVALMDRAGVASSFSFVLANCVFLAAGLAAVWQMMGRANENSRRWVVLLTLLSFPVVRSVAMPLPEAAYFGISLVTLALILASARASGVARALLILACLALIPVAMSIRPIGLALIPALLWACAAGPYRRFVAARGGRNAAALTVAVLATCLVLAAVAFGRDLLVYYWEQAMLAYPSGRATEGVVEHLHGHVRAVGELVVNVPYIKVRRLEPLFFAVGAVIVIVAVALTRVRGHLTPADVYVAGFLAVLAIWPHSVARLWMPVVPLLIGYVARFVFRPGFPSRWILPVRICVAWFVVTGLGAIAFTSRSTLAGENFATVYGVAGGMSTMGEGGAPRNEIYDRQALELMNRYGTAAQRAVK